MMRGVARLCIIILSISPPPGSLVTARPRTDGVSWCLMKKQYYHPQSGSCHSPLDPGVCPSGEWLLPADKPGELECCPAETLPEDCTPALLPGRSKVVCEENIVKERYRRGQCGPGEFVLPENFQADTLPCPEFFSCRQTRNSSLYYRALKTLQDVGGFSYKHDKEYLKDLACDFQSHSLCLPDHETDSLFRMETMLSSLKAPLDRCKPNPCSAGRRPWLGEDGYYRCLLAAPDTLNCPWDFLNQQGDRLHCQLLGVKSVEPFRLAKCPRRKIWSIYRKKCIIIYG